MEHFCGPRDISRAWRPLRAFPDPDVNLQQLRYLAAVVDQ
jgi:hypothetical protein